MVRRKITPAGNIIFSFHLLISLLPAKHPGALGLLSPEPYNYTLGHRPHPRLENLIFLRGKAKKPHPGNGIWFVFPEKRRVVRDHLLPFQRSTGSGVLPGGGGKPLSQSGKAVAPDPGPPAQTLWCRQSVVSTEPSGRDVVRPALASPGQPRLWTLEMGRERD